MPHMNKQMASFFSLRDAIFDVFIVITEKKDYSWKNKRYHWKLLKLV